MEENSDEVEILADVLLKLDEMKVKYPEWPSNPLYAASMIGKEYSQLIADVLCLVLKSDYSKISDVKENAIQTAAVCLRFLLNINSYQFDQNQC